MSFAYRSEEQAARDRMATLAHQAHALAARATEVFWRSMPDDLAYELAALERASRPYGRALQALLAAQHALERRVELLERALAGLPQFEAEWNALPPVAPPVVQRARAPAGVHGAVVLEREPILAPQPHGDATLAQARDVVAGRYAVERAAVQHGRALVSFAAQGAPFVLAAGTVRQLNLAQPETVVATSVRRATLPLEVRPEGFFDGLLKTVALRREVEVGDAEFDGRFLIRGEPAAAAAMLPPAVRDAILRIARSDEPTLTVRRGAAWLRWRAEPSAATLEAAVCALATIRRAPPSIRLRNAT